MAVVGYLRGASCAEKSEWRKHNGCDRVYCDYGNNEWERLQWKATVAELAAGDTLIVKSLASAVGSLCQLVLLLTYCQMKGVRLVSLADDYDSAEHETADSLSNEMPISLSLLNRFSESLLNPGNQHRATPDREIDLSDIHAGRTKQEKKAIALYLVGHSVKTITRHLGIGKSTLYRTLARHGISRSRNPNGGRHRLKA